MITALSLARTLPTGELLLVVALSFALGWGLANARVPEARAELIDFDLIVVYDIQFLRVLSMVILAILADMILGSLIPVLLPIILPTLLAYDIDLIHFGVLMVIAVVIGQGTPPLAIALVITGKLARVDQIQVLRANLPFLWGMLAFLLLIMAVPELATWLQRLWLTISTTSIPHDWKCLRRHDQN